MSAELHLPDLPEVSLSVGEADAPQQRSGNGRGSRPMRDWVNSLLPLVLMAMLAAFVWYLSRLAVTASNEPALHPVSHAPDYSLKRFHSERFDATGRLEAVLEGEELHHFPDSDEIEIDKLQLSASDAQGRRVDALALHARISADGNRVELRGGASVRSQAPDSEAATLEGEHLVLFIHEQVVEAASAVTVRQGQSEFRANALRYDGRSRQLSLSGPAQLVFSKSR